MKDAIHRFLMSSIALLMFAGFSSAMPAQMSANIFRTALGADISSTLRMFVDDNRAPEVPDTIAVPDGQKVHFHGYAVGFQIYTWDGLKWGPAVPDATLFDDDGNVVATHFRGPTWRSNSGSEVVGKSPLFAEVDKDSIPWVRLTADETRTHGPGIFANTTFIHRVNTVGGKAPSVDGTVVGQVAKMPYTADYFFYRDTNK